MHGLCFLVLPTQQPDVQIYQKISKTSNEIFLEIDRL